jgi:cytochrome c oxidase subunit II
MVNRLEVAWTLVVVGLIAGVGAYSTILVYQLDALPTHADEYVNVIGHQWYWEFCYSNNTCFDSTYNQANNTVSGGALWAKPGTVVQINVTGADVVHSFNIPQLGVRIDAIPDRVNQFAFTVPNAPIGTQYLIQCTEYCGTFHGTMRSFLELV